MITEKQAIMIAKRVAKCEGWTWLAPVSVSRRLSRKTTRAKKVYELVVNTHINGYDCNLCVVIDQETGDVLDGHFHGYPGLPVGLKKTYNSYWDRLITR
ncbi:MAG: hypothetical protein JXN60_07625 [Lentisphaerae bacterium]|nr:hypothetical protein [Lentisphaerota bacterium]